jgi:hypothetical protein
VDALASEFLMEMRLKVGLITSAGAFGQGERRFAVVDGGRFEGPRLAGDILGGGSDAILVEPGGRTRLDVRLMLRSDDGAAIYTHYRGIRTGPAPVLARLAAGEAVDPSEYYFRTAVMFETGDARYGWLNDLIAVGVGHRPPTGPVYRVFAIR